MKTTNDLKTVMSVLSKEEKTNKYWIYDFNSVQYPNATPDPKMIFKNDPDPATALIGPL